MLFYRNFRRGFSIRIRRLDRGWPFCNHLLLGKSRTIKMHRFIKNIRLIKLARKSNIINLSLLAFKPIFYKRLINYPENWNMFLLALINININAKIRIFKNN